MSVTEEASAAANATTDVTPGEHTPGDEQGGMSLIGTPPLSDPAILAVNPKFRYGKEELLKLREAPLSQRKPDFLDVNKISLSMFDPTVWNIERKKSEASTENGGRGGDAPDHRRRPGDPRERIRKEDGIVLSPQRRSFNSGCFVPLRESRSNSNRSHSPLGNKNETSHMGGRDIPANSRRIGSGRILRDSWDFAEKSETTTDQDYNFSRPQEKRTFGRDLDKDKRNGSRFNERRRISGSESRDEEPEWFSGGPSSQNDTIELRGFDESDRPGKKKMSPSQAKRARDWFKKKNESSSNVTEEKDEIMIEEGPGGRSTPTKQAEEKTQNGQLSKETSSGEQSGEGDSTKQHDKNINDQSSIFEDILKSDTIPGLPGLLTNGAGGDGESNTKSRFSKWFTVENASTTESRRSSIQDDGIIKNLLKDLNETNVAIPGDSDSYFAPISPAANTAGSGLPSTSKSINIMEMLQRSKQNEMNKSQIPGRIMNLVELEAKIRQNSEPQMTKHQTATEDDMTAFNRLLANLSVNNVATTPNGPQKSQPLSLMEMLSRSQQQDEAQARMAHLLGPASPGAADLAARFQHAQNQQQQKQVEMLTKLMNAGMPIRASPLPDLGLQQSRELLNRPEAQAILHGLKVGDITPQHLYQQLANPALQPRHREMLATILKLQGTTAGGVGPSPRVLSPVAPHSMYQQQQQLRVSPLPPNAMHQRIPSPRELQVHTQNILQRALIKKKLEEQQENFRKKQEMQQRGQSPNNNNNSTQQPAKSVSSPTPLAFTPTSVLRKMTADKDEGGKDVAKLVDAAKLNQGRAVTGMRPQQQQSSGQQQSQQQQQAIGTQWPFQMKQAGRPIVKANNFQPPQQEFFTQQQQQKFLSQLQQQQQQRKQQQFGGLTTGGHAQHPQQFPNQQFSHLTQQQLRAQHQQHARPVNAQQAPQQQQQQGGYGNHQQQQSGSWQPFLSPPQQQQNRNQGGRNGDVSPTTSNQLTRWFSPDLLERARVGELPSTASLQHVLSSEEIERLTAPPVHN